MAYLSVLHLTLSPSHRGTCQSLATMKNPCLRHSLTYDHFWVRGLKPYPLILLKERFSFILRGSSPHWAPVVWVPENNTASRMLFYMRQEEAASSHMNSLCWFKLWHPDNRKLILGIYEYIRICKSFLLIISSIPYILLSPQGSCKDGETDHQSLLWQK